METSEVKLTEEQKQVRSAVVRALWAVDRADTEFEDTETKRAAFVEMRPKYVQKANRLLRHFEKLGVSLSISSN